MFSPSDTASVEKKTRKGGWYGWKPSSSSTFSIRAFRACPLVEHFDATASQSAVTSPPLRYRRLRKRNTPFAKALARQPCSETALQPLIWRSESLSSQGSSSPESSSPEESFFHRHRYDMIWYDMIWYDVILYDMIWYDVIWGSKCVPACIHVGVRQNLSHTVWQKVWSLDAKPDAYPIPTPVITFT